MANADQIVNVNVADSKEETYGYKQRACDCEVSGQSKEDASIQAVSIEMARVPHSVNSRQMTYQQQYSPCSANRMNPEECGYNGEDVQ
jgi:hypothetical protein